MATLVITRGYHKNHTKSPGLWSFSRPSGDHPGVNSGDNPKCLGPWGRAPTIPSQIKDFLCTKSKTKWALIGQNFVCVYIYIYKVYSIYLVYIYIYIQYTYININYINIRVYIAFINPYFIEIKPALEDQHLPAHQVADASQPSTAEEAHRASS